MSGTSQPIIDLPPGVFSDSTQYATGPRWYRANQVRWINGVMLPVGGWVSLLSLDVGTPAIVSLTVPTAFNTVDAGPHTYSFAGCALGTAIGRRVIVAVVTGFSVPVAPVAADVVVTVDGIACTNIALESNQYFTAFYITNSPVLNSTGTITVQNTNGGFTTRGCAILTFAVVGGDFTAMISAVSGQSATNTVSTPSLAIPPNGGAIAVTRYTNVALDATDIIWAGRTLTGATSYAITGVNTACLTATNLGGPAGLTGVVTATGTNINSERNIIAIAIPPTVAAGIYAIRDLFSWRDDLKNPWLVAGSANKLWGVSISVSSVYTKYDITPPSLVYNPSGLVGFGRGAFGSGPFGKDSTGIALDTTALWSMDNWGKNLIAVHSQDGRLFQWNPVTPTVVAAVVATAPIDNTLCIATEEDFAMVMGGKNNPRRVKWSSQRDITDWTPTETNTAGGFDLKSNGTIIACQKVQGGILVVTDTDVHMIEYIGAPNYYGHRKISDQGSILGKNCITAVPGGAMWMGASNFWVYDGNVAKLDCTIHTEVFYNSSLTQPSLISMGFNEFAQEVWISYPSLSSGVPDVYAAVSFSKSPYWTQGIIPRTAWVNPVWQVQPVSANGNVLYNQETGALADGVSRNGIIYAESGAIELGTGDRVMRVDRVWQDAGIEQSPSLATSDPGAYTIKFGLRQAPNAPLRDYGPVVLDDAKGYTVVRFRARQITARITQAKDEIWTMGKVRIRMKEAGAR